MKNSTTKSSLLLILAAIAITVSLSFTLSDETGKSKTDNTASEEAAPIGGFAQDPK